MQPPNENPAEQLKRGGVSKSDQIGVSIRQETTENHRSLQAFRLSARFGLPASTAFAVAALAFGEASA